MMAENGDIEKGVPEAIRTLCANKIWKFQFNLNIFINLNKILYPSTIPSVVFTDIITQFNMFPLPSLPMIALLHHYDLCNLSYSLFIIQWQTLNTFCRYLSRNHPYQDDVEEDDSKTIVLFRTDNKSEPIHHTHHIVMPASHPNEML